MKLQSTNSKINRQQQKVFFNLFFSFNNKSVKINKSRDINSSYLNFQLELFAYLSEIRLLRFCIIEFVF
jgi:hypothetical protein